MGRKSRAQRLGVVVGFLEVIRSEMERIIFDEYDISEYKDVDPDELTKSKRAKYDEFALSFSGKINDQISLAQNHTDALRTMASELQDWLDNMPENLQGGEKYNALESAISELEDGAEAIENLEDISDPSEAQNIVNEMCDAITTLESSEIPRMIG